MAIQLSKLPGADGRSEISSLNDLAPEMQRLLDEPIYATVATLRKSGPPHITIVWCDRDEKYVYINSSKGRIKDLNLRARPDVSLNLMNPRNNYHWLTVEGKVVEMIDEEDPNRAAEVTQHIDDLGEFYVKKRPYPNRFPGEVRVKYKIEPTRIVAFGPIGEDR